MLRRWPTNCGLTPVLPGTIAPAREGVALHAAAGHGAGILVGGWTCHETNNCSAAHQQRQSRKEGWKDHAADGLAFQVGTYASVFQI